MKSKFDDQGQARSMKILFRLSPHVQQISRIVSLIGRSPFYVWPRCLEKQGQQNLRDLSCRPAISFFSKRRSQPTTVREEMPKKPVVQTASVCASPEGQDSRWHAPGRSKRCLKTSARPVGVLRPCTGKAPDLSGVTPLGERIAEEVTTPASKTTVALKNGLLAQSGAIALASLVTSSGARSLGSSLQRTQGLLHPLEGYPQTELELPIA
jgi:hypothetical protein